MVTTRPPKTIVKPTALGPVANTDTKLLIYGLFQKRPSFGTGRGQRALRSVSSRQPWSCSLRARPVDELDGSLVDSNRPLELPSASGHESNPIEGDRRIAPAKSRVDRSRRIGVE